MVCSLCQLLNITSWLHTHSFMFWFGDVKWGLRKPFFCFSHCFLLGAWWIKRLPPSYVLHAFSQCYLSCFVLVELAWTGSPLPSVCCYNHSLFNTWGNGLITHPQRLHYPPALLFFSFLFLDRAWNSLCSPGRPWVPGSPPKCYDYISTAPNLPFTSSLELWVP